jgi:hypothetical protein
MHACMHAQHSRFMSTCLNLVRPYLLNLVQLICCGMQLNRTKTVGLYIGAATDRLRHDYAVYVDETPTQTGRHHECGGNDQAAL